MRIMRIVLVCLICVTATTLQTDGSAAQCQLGCRKLPKDEPWRFQVNNGQDVIYVYDDQQAEVLWGPPGLVGGVRVVVWASINPPIPAFVNRFDCDADPYCDPRQLPEEMDDPSNPMNQQAVVKWTCQLK